MPQDGSSGILQLSPIKDTQDGTPGQEPHHGKVHPKPAKPGDIAPERKECVRG